MKKIAALMLPAALLITVHARAADVTAVPQNVSYSLTLIAGGTPTVVRRVVAITGMPISFSNATDADKAVTSCSFNGADAKVEIKNDLTVGNRLDVTIFPAAVADGRVATLVSATVGHGEKAGVTTIGDCQFTTGSAHDEAATEVANLKVGESKSIHLGADTILVVKREQI